MDAGIFDHLDRVVRAAVREHDEKRTDESELLVAAMLDALAAAEWYRERQR